MKDKIPKSEKAQKQEEKQARGQFIPCGRIVNGGAFYENGAECHEGLWWYWATAFDDTGNDMYGKKVRWARECDCLKRWKAGLAELPATRGPQPALPDGKSRGTGGVA
jgi:hypothetical protein